MGMAVAEVVNESTWKLRTLLRAQRYYTDADLTILYKDHMLSFLEYRTPAVYHALSSTLSRLDSVQRRFSGAGIDDLTALVEFRLPPPFGCQARYRHAGPDPPCCRGRGPWSLQDFFSTFRSPGEAPKETSGPEIRTEAPSGETISLGPDCSLQ